MSIMRRGLAIVALGVLSNAALAQETGNDAWEFRIGPYLWGTAIDGHVAHAQLPIRGHAHMGFGDVWDDLDAGAMGTFEARKGQFGLFSDGLYAKVSTTVHAPVAGMALPVRLNARAATGLVAFQYRWVDDEAGHLDLVAGVRAWSVRTRLAYALPVPVPLPIPQRYSGSQRETWTDLQLGIKGRRQFSNGMFVGGWVLAGGGGADLSTDAMLLVGYGINDRLSLVAGYRWLSTDYKTSNGFAFDATLQGPGIGLEYRF